MTYENKIYKIEELVKLIDTNQIDLNPSYQRNFIWSPIDQIELIDTIKKGFPLPAFFVYQKPNGNFEMVDGQQRSKTIYRYVKGQIKDSSGSFFEAWKDGSVCQYNLNFTVIKDLLPNETLNDYYVLINKKGKHLNTPEVYKSEFEKTRFMKLCNELLGLQDFIDLNIFTEATSKRMNDRAYIEELIVYLQHGITDKKSKVEPTYERDLTDEEVISLKADFTLVLGKLKLMNEIKAFTKTRYKQKNDFFTLFNFIHINSSILQETLNIQYKILIILDGKETETELQFIRPTNENCEPLKNYALHCVSQSNSKNARVSRLRFFSEILKNEEIEKNESLKTVVRYIEKYTSIQFTTIRNGGFQLITVI